MADHDDQFHFIPFNEPETTMKFLLHGALTLAVVAFIQVTPTAAIAQDVQVRTIKLGHLNQPDHPMSVGVRKFAEIVAVKSSGKLKIREFGAASLGNEAQQLSALQGGVQEMMTLATTSLAGSVKEFGLLDFPFSIESTEQADALVDGPLGEALLAQLPAKGLIGLAFWENGFRNLTNSKRPIVRVEDLSGLKIRVLPNPVYIEAFKAMGVNPVPLAFSELYGALESRAVDAQENPLGQILASRLFEVQHYLSITNHAYNTFPILASKSFWDKLSPVERKILKDAAIEAGQFQRKLNREFAAKARAQLETNGMKINEVPPTELAKLRQMVKKVNDDFASQYDPLMLRLYQSEILRTRPKQEIR